MGRIAGVIAFLLCLIGGLWVALHAKDDAVSMGLGLYFIGKAFFVGPMLFLTAEQLGRRVERE